jgi:hypothetical protein
MVHKRGGFSGLVTDKRKAVKGWGRGTKEEGGEDARVSRRRAARDEGSDVAVERIRVQVINHSKGQRK